MSHRNVKFLKQEQPSFIRKFKQKAGMKSEATVEDKFAELTSNCDDEEKEDEKPVIVVMDKNVTSEDVEKYKSLEENSADKQEETSQKITFRKPTKRSQDSALSATSKKVKPNDNKKKNREKNSSKAVDGSKELKKKKPPNSSLLSFQDDDG